MKRTIFWALLLIAAGCSSPKNTRTADPLRVTTIVAAPSAGFGAAVYVGSVEEEASASLSFPVAGTVAVTPTEQHRRKGAAGRTRFYFGPAFSSERFHKRNEERCVGRISVGFNESNFD